MYKFNDNNIFVSYIKGLLHDFNLPMIEAWTPNKQLYKDQYYIYKNYIVRAKESTKYSSFNIDNFKVIADNYVFGNHLINMTKKLRLDSLFYDSYTHNYLGDYLRFYRDYTNINLMPLYNCFSEASVSNLSIYDNTGTLLLQSDENSTVYMINVIPFKEYTIFMECEETVEFICGYYSNNQSIDVNSLELGEGNNITFPYSDTYLKKNSVKFNKPFLYSNLKNIQIGNADKLYPERKNLKLFIKIPKNIKSSVVILEGDYTKGSELHFDNNDLDLSNLITSYKYTSDDEGKISKKNIQDTEATYNTRSQLALINSGINHPFSDKLVGYLMENTITPRDTIDNNIIRVQHKLVGRNIKDSKLDKVSIEGIWDNSIRNVLYGAAKKKNLLNTKYDILGYVDKDIEEEIKLKDGEE